MTGPVESRKHGVLIGLAFSLLVLLCLGFFLVPAFIIQPFRLQTPSALALAMAVKQVAPVWGVVAAGAALLLAFVLWRRVSTWKKVLLVLGICLAAAATWMARVDYFEWMFHPVITAGFESAESSKLDPAQMVMTVRFGDDARAYPIRAMAYHHVFNDVVGGVPIAVTY